MDKLLPFFPLNSKVKKGDGKSLALVIVIYCVASFVIGLIAGILANIIPIVGFVFPIISYLFGVYSTAGIVIAIVYFCMKD